VFRNDIKLGGIERERERETDRQTDIQRDRQTNRQRKKERKREKESRVRENLTISRRISNLRLPSATLVTHKINCVCDGFKRNPLETIQEGTDVSLTHPTRSSCSIYWT